MATKEDVHKVLELVTQNKIELNLSVEIASPIKCDLCPAPQALVDGKTTTGIWADMCIPCFSAHGVGLGVGRGQALIWKC